MVELLVDRVLVAEDEVEIRYVVPAHPNSEKVRSCHLRKDYFDDVVQIGAVRQRQRRPSSPVCFNTATALAYAGCPSTLITRGRGAPLHNASRRNSLAAIESRLGDNMNSIVSPAESTAQYRYAQRPATLT